MGVFEKCWVRKALSVRGRMGEENRLVTFCFLLTLSKILGA